VEPVARRSNALCSAKKQGESQTSEPFSGLVPCFARAATEMHYTCLAYLLSQERPRSLHMFCLPASPAVRRPFVRSTSRMERREVRAEHVGVHSRSGVQAFGRSPELQIKFRLGYLASGDAGLLRAGSHEI
jgi:hypothetical protein